MTTEQAKQVLRDAGYFVDNLWHIHDVMDRYECNEGEAQEILYDSLTNEWIVEKTFLQMQDFAETRGIKEKEDDHYYQVLFFYDDIDRDIIESASYNKIPSDSEIKELVSETKDCTYVEVYEQWGDDGKLLQSYSFKGEGGNQ